MKMKMKIVADSSANLQDLTEVKAANTTVREKGEPADVTEGTELAFASVPVHIMLGDQDIADTAVLDLKAFQKALKEYKGKTTTAAPSPGEWVEAFGDADVIFCFTLTSAMSGTYNSAVIAGESYEAEHPGAKVYVIDSRSTGPEMVLLVEKARELILSGKAPEQIDQELKVYQQKTHLYFSLASVENFAKNGRIHPLIAKGIGLMGIRLVGTASEAGTLEVKGKCRGDKKAWALILDAMENCGYRGGRVILAHNQNEEGAQNLKTRMNEAFGNIPVVIQKERALCCYYAEPGSVMVGFETE